MPLPIEPSWIIEGNPDATGRVLSYSADRLAWTMVWHCTAGKFNWDYDFDETLLILEGAVVLESDATPRTYCRPGEVVFFRRGAHARWHIESHVKKIAFCRRSPPAVLHFAERLFLKLKKLAPPQQTASHRAPGKHPTLGSLLFTP